MRTRLIVVFLRVEMPGSPHRFSVNLDWLIKLRWVAVVGQLLTIVGTLLLLDIRFAVWPLAIVIGLTAISNILLSLWASKPSLSAVDVKAWSLILGLVMTMDMFSLTALLYTTGGPANPFCLFFFVNLSLSAVVLDRDWAWGMNVLAVLCFAWLLTRHVPVPELEADFSQFALDPSRGWALPQTGLLVAFATCGSVIVYFMTRLTSELRQHEADLRLVQQRKASDDKLEALGTLAAGAAHELATPLTTIALVAKDVEHELSAGDGVVSADVIQDVGLIREQLDRCKKILDRMSSHAGQAVGEMTKRVTISELWQTIVDGLETEQQAAICFEDRTEGRSDGTNDAGSPCLDVPLDAISQALRGLVQNALDVTPVRELTRVLAEFDDGHVVLTIEDVGPGMRPEILERVSEPFFTTKQPGKGMGLGVFLARNVIERLAGSLEIQSEVGRGTVVRAWLPLAS